MMIDYKSQSKISDPNYEVYYKVFLENYEFLKDHSSFKTKMKITIIYLAFLTQYNETKRQNAF